MQTTKEKIASGQDVLLNADEAARLLRIKKSWIYQLVFYRKIPVYRLGKKLLFSKSELMEIILRDRQKTLSEIESEAANHLS